MEGSRSTRRPAARPPARPPALGRSGVETRAGGRQELQLGVAWVLAGVCWVGAFMTKVYLRWWRAAGGSSSSGCPSPGFYCFFPWAAIERHFATKPALFWCVCVYVSVSGGGSPSGVGGRLPLCAVSPFPS